MGHFFVKTSKAKVGLMLIVASCLMLLATSFKMTPGVSTSKSSALVQPSNYSPRHVTLLQHTSLKSQKDEIDQPPFFSGDSLVKDTSVALRRVSWLSWWCQVILSTISAVTLVFARNVILASSPAGASQKTDGFFLAGSGIVMSFFSILWTWGEARLAKRFVTIKDGSYSMTRIAAANLLRRAVRISCLLNLVGILCSVLGAEQIVGMLAVKVLTRQGVIANEYAAAGLQTQSLQPLDILVVQANTNTLLSHFCSLVLSLYLISFIDKLDPPSVEQDKRRKPPPITGG